MNIKCPIHGEHGNSIGEECAYCHAEGKTVHVPIPESGEENPESEFLEEIKEEKKEE